MMAERDSWLRRIDGFCARLNAGMTAVAVALAIVVTVQLTARVGMIFESVQQQLADQVDPAQLTPVLN